MTASADWRFAHRKVSSRASLVQRTVFWLHAPDQRRRRMQRFGWRGTELLRWRHQQLRTTSFRPCAVRPKRRRADGTQEPPRQSCGERRQRDGIVVWVGGERGSGSASLRDGGLNIPAGTLRFARPTSLGCGSGGISARADRCRRASDPEPEHTVRYFDGQRDAGRHARSGTCRPF